MPRRSLKPQLNQIRAWVHQGRTDAWIAHQLEITATELREFRKQYDLSADDENAGTSEIDLRDEIEAEIEAAAAAMGALAAHKLRSALTLLGVLVGVFSIIVVTCWASTKRESVYTECANGVI